MLALPSAQNTFLFIDINLQSKTKAELLNNIKGLLEVLNLTSQETSIINVILFSHPYQDKTNSGIHIDLNHNTEQIGTKRVALLDAIKRVKAFTQFTIDLNFLCNRIIHGLDSLYSFKYGYRSCGTDFWLGFLPSPPPYLSPSPVEGAGLSAHLNHVPSPGHSPPRPLQVTSGGGPGSLHVTAKIADFGLCTRIDANR